MLRRERLYVTDEVETALSYLREVFLPALPALYQRWDRALGLERRTQAAVFVSRLDRSDGAVKQLQLRGVRNLAKLMPEGLRD